MKFDNLFKYISVINLDSRKDRWEECCIEFGRIGSNMEGVKRLSAIQTEPHGAIGCGFSHALALMHFLIESNEPYCLILEDDFSFKNEIHEVLESVKSFLQNENWSTLLLSGNEVKTITCESDIYLRVLSSKTTGAYLVNRNYVPRMIEKFLLGSNMLKKYMPIIPPYHWETLLDLWAADMVWQDLQKEGNWFILNPIPIIQRPSYSDIMKQNVDYKV